jgi:hypothetical protein
MGENGSAALVMGRWSPDEAKEAFVRFAMADRGAGPPERDALRDLAMEFAGYLAGAPSRREEFYAALGFQGGFLAALELLGELDHELLAGRAS